MNPHTGQTVKQLGARALFDLIVNAAWRTGDPGLIFLDQINRRNPTPDLGSIEATNPCGEVPLLPYESCILASINLDRMTKDHEAGERIGRASVDWGKLRDRIHWGVRFLDDVIDVNGYPLESIRARPRGNRKIGLGVMGFADLLIRLGIPYNSREAVSFAARLMRFVHRESLAASEKLARERGVFPNFEKSIYARSNHRLRNATVNTIAPTGTISIIAGCSSGIEPLFAVSFVRNVLSGTHLFETNPLFEQMAKDRGFYSRELLAEVAQASLPGRDQGHSERREEALRDHLRRPGPSPPGDPGGVPAVHGQRRLQNDQPARRRDGRGRPRDLPGGASRSSAKASRSTVTAPSPARSSPSGRKRSPSPRRRPSSWPSIRNTPAAASAASVISERHHADQSSSGWQGAPKRERMRLGTPISRPEGLGDGRR